MPDCNNHVFVTCLSGRLQSHQIEAPTPVRAAIVNLLFVDRGCGISDASSNASATGNVSWAGDGQGACTPSHRHTADSSNEGSRSYVAFIGLQRDLDA